MTQTWRVRCALLGIFCGVCLCVLGQPAGACMSAGQVARANNGFGLRLMSALLAEADAENVFLSPYSLFSALMAVSTGASGDTSEAMQLALGLPGAGEPAADAAFAQLSESLSASSKGIELSSANSLWVRDGVFLRESFLQAVRDCYDAHIAHADFADAATPRIINQWVKEKTGGHIEDIVGDIHPQAILFLINAVYFDGQWTEPFDPDCTSQRPFYAASGEAQAQDMMRRSGQYQYLAADGFAAVRIPYGQGEQVGFYAFLPEKDASVSSLLVQLQQEPVSAWLSRMEVASGTVTLPRFAVRYEKNFAGILSLLGMQVAFDRQEANFARMSPEQVWIEKVKHKAFLELDEQGTEAAAATSVEMRVTAIAPQGFSLVFDRPFFYLIRDETTGVVLFCGAFMHAG